MFENGLFYKDAYGISKKLSEKIQDSYNAKVIVQRQLLNVIDDLLIVWSKEDACFYCQIFQPLNNDENDKNYKIQTLILNRPPIWDVNCIITNQAATGILLVGNKGLAVVELPKRWGNPSLFEGGKDIVACKVEYVGEHFLACAANINVISAAWHPGSLNYSHILMLSSDNYLRIYNTSSLGIPDKVYAVGKGRGRPGSKLGGDVAMGEMAIAFDVGPPSRSDSDSSTSDGHQKFIDYIHQAEEIKRRHYSLEWPIFILYSNGDVYYIISSLNPKSSHSSTLYGPLTMLPNSFDNFGLEFCNLIVLHCHPIVLVIGNSKGCMHHCIIMEKTENTEASPEGIDELSNSITQLSLVSPNYVLHVYETVHLSLSADSKEKLLLPPLLITDPITPTRYWLMHKDGIYMVYVPLIEKLIHYASISDKYLFPESDLECQIEHFLCTQTLTSVKTTSIIGLSISYSPSNVFVMLATGAIAILPLPSLYVPYMPNSQLDQNSPDPTPNSESFGSHIRDILRRSASQPLLISGIDQTLPLQDHLNLLKHVQDTLRKNYIIPQLKAKEEIGKRRKILGEQKDHLQKEIASILSEKQILMDQAHNIAEKYEEANDKHSDLMKRLEKVLNHFVRDLPTLSIAEREMHTELEDLTEKSQSFSSDIAQIKAKHQWHLSQKSKQEFNEALQSKRSSNLSENQLACLKVTLSKESDKLALLAKGVKQLKSEFGV